MPEPTILFRGEFHSEAQRLLAATDPRPVLDEMGNMKVSRLVRGMTRGGGESIPGLPPVNRSGAFRARFLRGFWGRFHRGFTFRGLG